MTTENQNTAFQLTKALVETVKTLIHSKNDKALQELVSDFHYADIAEILDEISLDDAIYVFKLLDSESLDSELFLFINFSSTVFNCVSSIIGS